MIVAHCNKCHRKLARYWSPGRHQFLCADCAAEYHVEDVAAVDPYSKKAA